MLRPEGRDCAPWHLLPYHYTLPVTPPHLPAWFGPAAVLQAVGELDDGNDGNGSTFAQIRDSLLQTHQPPPPGFETVLRMMLAVLRQRGHLTWPGSQWAAALHAAAQAPALVEPNPVHIPPTISGATISVTSWAPITAWILTLMMKRRMIEEEDAHQHKHQHGAS